MISNFERCVSHGMSCYCYLRHRTLHRTCNRRSVTFNGVNKEWLLTSITLRQDIDWNYAAVSASRLQQQHLCWKTKIPQWDRSRRRFHPFSGTSRVSVVKKSGPTLPGGVE